MLKLGLAGDIIALVLALTARDVAGLERGAAAAASCGRPDAAGVAPLAGWYADPHGFWLQQRPEQLDMFRAQKSHPLKSDLSAARVP